MRTPELATTISLEPWERFGVDAVIVFADILTPFDGLGFSLSFDGGLKIVPAIRSAKQFDRLSPFDPVKQTPYLFETLKRLKKEIDGRAALIGFAGGPFTLATYLIEGGSVKDMPHTREWMEKEPDTLKEFLSLLTDMVTNYLSAQIAAGADIAQIFESSAHLLNKVEYKEWAHPYSREVLLRLRGENVPTILFARGSANFLPELKDAGAFCVGIDHLTEMVEARKILGHSLAIQGNIPPDILLASPKIVADETQRLLELVRHHKGHIINLGHGVLPETSVACVKAMVDTVKNFR